MDLSDLMADEEVQLKKLRDLVNQAVKEEEMLSSKLIELELDQDISIGQKLADKVAGFGGSWLFILSFCLFIFVWISWNIQILKTSSFDPYPFILLNLILSCIAAFQAPVIMMSQNRQEDKDRRRARNDFMVNLKAEMEVRSLHQKMDLLISEQMQSLFKIQQAQIEILNRIESDMAKAK